MALFEGTNNDDTLRGGAQADTVVGLRGDDVLGGSQNDDFINGGRDNDSITGGMGSDVMFGGLGSDAFFFRSVDDGAVDWICDFSLSQGDTLVLEGDISFISAVRVKLTETEFNGYDLRNNVDRGTDIVFTVQNAGGDTATINLLDVWSQSLNAAWVTYLETFGVELT